MTSVLSPMAPAGVAARDAAMPVAGQSTARAIVPVATVETPRAPMPADAINRAAVLRNRTPDQRPVDQRPVGPPPSFEINVLQDMLMRRADPVPPTATLPEPRQLLPEDEPDEGEPPSGAETEAPEDAVEGKDTRGGAEIDAGRAVTNDPVPSGDALQIAKDPPHILDKRL